MESFQRLKHALTTSPVLTSPNFESPFLIQYDASNVGIGAVLFQADSEGGVHPIKYFSKKLNAAERNYSATVKECLAVVAAVAKFRPFVELMDFTILTDHASLKWLMNHKDLSRRLARWSLSLQRFTFKIEHKKDSENVDPDMLSSLYMEAVDLENIIG